MTKISPAQFAKQVKQEGSRVTWPSRKETLASSGMVLVMTTIAALFFLLVDWVVSSSVQTILGL
jgi:preprotein translocase subunit SecE